MAGGGVTFVYFCLAVGAGVALQAGTGDDSCTSVGRDLARSIVHAGVFFGEAAGGELTHSPSKQSRAVAGEVINGIIASASVLAGRGGTVVNVDVTEVSSESWVTVAGEGTHSVHTGTLHTWIGGTVVYVCLALSPREALRTGALEVEEAIGTVAVVLTRHGEAGILREREGGGRREGRREGWREAGREGGREGRRGRGGGRTVYNKDMNNKLCLNILFMDTDLPHLSNFTMNNGSDHLQLVHNISYRKQLRVPGVG